MISPTTAIYYIIIAAHINLYRQILYKLICAAVIM